MNDQPTTASMYDVARAAKVSIATVSRTLSGRPGVSDATRQRVREVAERLNYVVSPEASGLARKSTGRVAVVVTSADLWFYSTLLAAIEHELRANQLDVLLYQIDGSDARHEFFADLPARRKADAVLVVTQPMLPAEAERLALLGMHVVTAGNRLLDYPSVSIDDREVGRLATQHLIDLGHRRIGQIATLDAEGQIWQADRERREGYRQALESAGLEIDPGIEIDVPFGLEGGKEAVLRLLDAPAPPTGTFVHSDEVAFGCFLGLRSRNQTFPYTMSLVGVDDHPFAGVASLSTVRQDVAAQGTLAARQVVRLLRGEELPERHVTVPVELVPRASSFSPESPEA
ncbi:LacI family transcriptional regulator [Nocardioidaceae bacterium]|nr:LacI family transcriptional regulator [Nocardioidaceae bacterium]